MTNSTRDSADVTRVNGAAVEIRIPANIAFDPMLSAAAVRVYLAIRRLEDRHRPADPPAVAAFLRRSLGNVERLFGELRAAGAIR